MKKMINPIQEKIIQVPQDLVEDISQDLFPFFLGLLVYNLELAHSKVKDDLEGAELAKEGRDRILSFFKMSLREAEKIATQIMNNPVDIISKKYNLTRYHSPYGDFKDVQPNLIVHLKTTPYQGLLGRHYSKTGDIIVYTQVLMSVLSRSSFEPLETKDIEFLTDIGLPAGKETYEMFQDFSELVPVLKKVKSKLRTTVEHELVHLIQATFFSGHYEDKEYYKRDMFSYEQSPVEEDPLLLDALEGLKTQYPHITDLGITRAEFEEYTSGIFRFWYKSPPKKKQEIINNFYHLVQDRIGIRN